MNRHWQHFGRMGKRKTGPIGRDGIVNLILREDRHVEVGAVISETNSRLAHCKVCGMALKAGEGNPIIIYAKNGYNVSQYYACEADYNWIDKELWGLVKDRM